MMQIKSRIAGADERIACKPPNGEVAGGMHGGPLRLADEVTLPPVSALFETINVRAVEEELDVAFLRLRAPEGADVARETAGVVG